MEGKQKIALTFAFYQGEQLVRRETVAQDIVKVGKDPKSHLRVDDEQASRMHAVIEVASDSDVTLIDLGNEAGTMVNGARVNKCKLNANDQIQIGETLIVLEAIEDAATIAVAQPAAGGEVAPSANVASAAAAAGAAVASDPFAPPAAAGGSNPFAVPAPTSNPFAAAANPFSSPFGARSSAGGVAADATEGSYEYKLSGGGLPLQSHEVETAASGLEVRISWGRSLLHVAHLTPPRPFFVGEGGVDYFVPQEKLGGQAKVSLVVPGPAAVILPGATGTVDQQGQSMTIADAIAQGVAQPSSALPGAHQVALNAGTHVYQEVGDLIFEVSTVNSGKAVGWLVGGSVAALLFGGALPYVLGSGVFQLGVLGAMYMVTPPMQGTDSDSISEDQRYFIQQSLDSIAERELEEKETEQIAEDSADNKEGGTGTRAKGEEGSMGNPNTNKTGNRYGVRGPADNQDPHIARQAALRDAAEFGMIGLLNSGAGGDPDAPTAPWGRDDSLGNDPLSARGNMWGDSIGDSFGAGGLGLSGIGEGGGGRGEGIGLGSIGTIGHGAGTGTGQGFGSGHGRLGRSHRARPPQVRMGATSVSGRLPPEVIQRIVRQNFGRFRLCYENGLRNNPNLQGRVSVRFVINRDGRVSNVGGGGDIPDGGVVSCVTRAFYGLSFPQPEGGIVTVSYPIVFTPGG